jgi:predicted O-linked N-acetylglucosamine transferase (SPINDLY family)
MSQVSEQDWDALFKKALANHQAGALEQAQASYTLLLQQHPHHPMLLHLLGLTHQQQGQLQKARPLLLESIEADPDNPAFHYDLGLLYGELQEWPLAIQSFQNALARKPQYPEALEALTATAEQLGYNTLAHQTCTELARFLEADRRPTDALHCWKKAVSLSPQNIETAFELGRLTLSLNQPEEAARILKDVVDRKPQHAKALLYLAQSLATLGNAAESQKCFHVLHQQTGLDGVLFRRLFTLPVIYESENAVEHWRERFSEELSNLEAHPLKIQNPVSEIGVTPFYLAYQETCEKPLMTRLAALLKKSLPPLDFTPTPSGRKRPRVAVVSRYLFQPRHTIHRLFGGLIAQLDRARFEVLACPVSTQEEQKSLCYLNPQDPMLSLSVYDYAGACKALQEASPDIILYPDIGMEPMTFYLALQRLAPVQCLLWGHPMTTGMPSMDYFLSNIWMESPLEQAQTHYHETLILHQQINLYLPPPEIPPPASKADLGLPPTAPILVCPQSLFKLHPGFDLILADILAQNPTARLVLIDGDTPSWNGLLEKRWSNRIPALEERLLWMPKGDQQAFYRLLSAADVVLDIPQFSGGKTSLDALAYGKPIVTWPKALMRQRNAAGLLGYLDVLDTVVSGVSQYVETVTRLLQEEDTRQEIQTRLQERTPILYQRSEAVRELETFLEMAQSQSKPI